MTPLDPVTPAEADPKPPAAPPYVDEDVNETCVELGREAADAELRDVAALENEDAPARTRVDPATEGNQLDQAERMPEVEAVHIDPAGDRK